MHQIATSNNNIQKSTHYMRKWSKNAFLPLFLAFCYGNVCNQISQEILIFSQTLDLVIVL